jgi:hypothetical protein
MARSVEPSKQVHVRSVRPPDPDHDPVGAARDGPSIDGLDEGGDGGVI